MISFIDMDGVLVDFPGAVAGLFGLSKSAAESRGDRLHEAIGVTKEEFWARIDAAGSGWWASMDPYPWAGRLIEACRRAGQVYVASSPAKCAAAGTGKMAWLRRRLPGLYEKKKFFLGADKHLLAAPGRVLVDDDAGKCAAFVAAGGRAALFPRPWNMGSLPAGATPERLIEGIERSGDFDGHLR